MTRTRYAGVLVVVVSSLLGAGTARGGDDPAEQGPPIMTHAGVRAALLYGASPRGTGWSASSRPATRSVPLAFGLSAAVPGLGQAYNRQWIKAFVAAGLESALITGYVVWRRQGLDAERAYQAFAHQFWDPTRYAAWLNDYQMYLNEVLNAGIDPVQIQMPAQIDFTHPEAWSAADRQIVNDFFSQIRSAERRVFHPETGAAFSHQLPNFGEQQYYELIGKYFQFAPGWYDYPAWKEGEAYTPAIDPEMTGSDGSKPNVSETFFRYARDHAHANDLLRRASRLSVLFLVNHLLAGVDAAVSARLHNLRLDTSFGFRYVPDGSARPVAVVRYGF